MPRTSHSAYQLTYWAKQMGSGDMTPEVSILDVDEGYDWVGGAEIELGTEWQHIAMEPVYTNENQLGHELQIAFMICATEGTVCFDDIQLYEFWTCPRHPLRHRHRRPVFCFGWMVRADREACRK